MNRRAFLLALPFAPAAAAAVVKSIAAQPEQLDLRNIFFATEEAPLPTAAWFQTTRMTCCYSMEYLDTIDAIFEKDPVKRRLNWHERRRVRFRENLARQLASRPLPLP